MTILDFTLFSVRFYGLSLLASCLLPSFLSALELTEYDRAVFCDFIPGLLSPDLAADETFLLLGALGGRLSSTAFFALRILS